MSSAPIDPSFIALQSAVAGRFSLESELGRGGMGIVYLARDVILERPVAIKLLAPALAAREDMRRRFLREARLAAQCFHPNIVPIHEVAEAGDLAWFVMAYVAGESLADRLRRVGPLPAEDVRRLGREIGWALAYAHERGVVHRDVKPENILIERGTGRALIADFGIAISHHGPSQSGEVAGTARYMAPEQALGETVDGRADLYALGVTLHVAATGTYPYDGQSLVAIDAQQSAEPAPSVRTRAPRLSAAVADAIDQCLANRPSERFDDVARFVQALERTPDGGELPVEARATRVAATGAGTLADWTFAIGYAAFFMVMGEESGSFGRMIMRGVAEGVLTFAAIATAVRGVEAVLAARTALQRGTRRCGGRAGAAARGLAGARGDPEDHGDACGRKRPRARSGRGGPPRTAGPPRVPGERDNRADAAGNHPACTGQCAARVGHGGLVLRIRPQAARPARGGLAGRRMRCSGSKPSAPRCRRALALPLPLSRTSVSTCCGSKPTARSPASSRRSSRSCMSCSAMSTPCRK
ncbi:MAG: serine/threonine protein kinase [Gemmatimonas sp.]|uniref:serine/threonine-protein kinase n=2 Tax=Gemmatimonas sp. TaxID=1962908 RepID=UPI0025C568F5|nr:serine/threonine-protein kinase [Gemmatimonas sp.]MCA2987102.1 serine/threonine protein kinase [Gemmatimonas sp.]